jgi:hypothetical protein
MPRHISRRITNEEAWLCGFLDIVKSPDKERAQVAELEIGD